MRPYNPFLPMIQVYDPGSLAGGANHSINWEMSVRGFGIRYGASARTNQGNTWRHRLILPSGQGSQSPDERSTVGTVAYGERQMGIAAEWPFYFDGGEIVSGQIQVEAAGAVTPALAIDALFNRDGRYDKARDYIRAYSLWRMIEEGNGTPDVVAALLAYYEPSGRSFSSPGNRGYVKEVRQSFRNATGFATNTTGGAFPNDEQIVDEMTVLRILFADELIELADLRQCSMQLTIDEHNVVNTGSATSETCPVDLMFGRGTVRHDLLFPLHIDSHTRISGLIDVAANGDTVTPELIFVGFPGKPEETIPYYAAWRRVVTGRAGMDSLDDLVETMARYVLEGN